MLEVVLDVWRQKSETVGQAGNSLIISLAQILKVCLSVTERPQAHDAQVDTFNVGGQNSKIL